MTNRQGLSWEEEFTAPSLLISIFCESETENDVPSWASLVHCPIIEPNVSQDAISRYISPVQECHDWFECALFLLEDGVDWEEVRQMQHALT